MIDLLKHLLRWLSCEELTEERQFALVYEVWYKRFWWRFPPPEGWRLGYNCSHLPQEAHDHVNKYGRVVRPTRNEIVADWNCYGAGKDVRLRHCPADTNIHYSLPRTA